MDRIDRVLKELELLVLPELCIRWTAETGEPAPVTRSAEWLRSLLAWRLQAQSLGGLPTKTKRQLAQLAKAYEKDEEFTPRDLRRALAPGTVISREWNGARHRVRVLSEGFEYDDHQYGSLSEVARAITGTRWSGPRFFGLDRSCVSRGRS